MKSLPGERTNLVCPDCGAAMPLVPNTKKKGTMCYQCVKGCCTHGARPNGKPLGVPADKATRAARVKAHRVFDRLWSGPAATMPREAAYRLMQKLMGVSAHKAHIARFDAAQCRTLIQRLREHQKG